MRKSEIERETEKKRKWLNNLKVVLVGRLTATTAIKKLKHELKLKLKPILN